jgi:hypothetical protein
MLAACALKQLELHRNANKDPSEVRIGLYIYIHIHENVHIAGFIDIFMAAVMLMVEQTLKVSNARKHLL